MVLVGSGHLSSVWDYSVHFAKISDLRFSKGYCSHSFHPVSTKLYGKHGNHGGIQAVSSFGDPPKIKNFMKCLLTQNHMGLEIPKGYSSYTVYPMSIKLHEDIGYHRQIQTIALLGNQPSFKSFVALWKFNMGVNGKIIKCAISWKRLTVEQSGWKFGNSVWGHSVHLQNFHCQDFQKATGPPVFIQFQSNFMESIVIAEVGDTGCYFLKVYAL